MAAKTKSVQPEAASGEARPKRVVSVPLCKDCNHPESFHPRRGGPRSQRAGCRVTGCKCEKYEAPPEAKGTAGTRAKTT